MKTGEYAATKRDRLGPWCLAGVLVAASFFVLDNALAWSWPDAMFGAPRQPKPPVAEWSYQGDKGPDRWGDLAPEYGECKGSLQSPVDLNAARAMPYTPLSFRYRSNPLHIVNDGRQIVLRYEPGSYMMAGGRRYELTELHFHVPGEHRVSGAGADMELQLHHRDARGRLAAVAVPIKAGRRMNSTLSRIWDNIPPVGGESSYRRQVGVNASFLLPPDKSYFSYRGSLTEPPCTEGVEWFVLSTPLEVDVSYVHRLGQVIGGNARPVQPLNGRTVLAVTRR